MLKNFELHRRLQLKLDMFELRVLNRLYLEMDDLF